MRSIRARGFVLAGSLVALLAVGCAESVNPTDPASPASPVQPDQRETRAGAYLALGDSVAAGAGASRPAFAYVPLLATKLEQAPDCADVVGCPVELIDLARGGATTLDVVRDVLPGAVRELRQRNGNADPGDDVRLITVTIGGNDVFGPVTEACRSGATAACAATASRQLQQVKDNYAVILRQLREAAGPATTLAVMAYYNPLPACDLRELASLGDVVLEGGDLVQSGLNGIVREQARTVDAVVVETGPVVDATKVQPDCLHPNDAGHAAIAQAFADAVSHRRRAPSSRR